ncbi:hypothetical protein KIPB_015699, partial [Kipferlia bialata]|eukprot:g15699.t1
MPGNSVPVSIQYHPAIRDCLFATTYRGGLYCLNTSTGLFTLLHQAEHTVVEIVTSFTSPYRICMLSDAPVMTTVRAPAAKRSAYDESESEDSNNE